MDKGTLRTVKGDVRLPERTRANELFIIPHCCNNLGAMGAGVALALRDKWPEVYTVYKEMEKESRFGLENRLGEICFAKVEDDIMVVNMIGQDGIVSEDNPKPVKYWALQSCMEQIRYLIDEKIIRYQIMTNLNPNPVIHTPKFGSDLAGGDWNFILELIREQWLEYGIDVVVYEFE